MRLEKTSKIHEKLSTLYWCKCGICKNSPRDLQMEYKNIIKIEEILKNILSQDNSIYEISFTKLLEIMPGANILIPEIGIFSQGILQFALKYDFIQKAIFMLKPIKLSQILPMILSETRKRRKNQRNFDIYKNEQKNSARHRMTAVLTKIDKKEEIFTEEEFIEMMIMRKNNEKWGNTEKIQSYIGGSYKAKSIKFLADYKGNNQEIIYNKKALNNTEEIMYNICINLANFLKENYSLELIYMKGIFINDSRNNFWLINAENIYMRKSDIKEKFLIIKQESQRRCDIEKNKVFSELDKIMEDDKHVENVEKFMRIISRNYEDMKIKIGLQNPDKIQYNFTNILKLPADIMPEIRTRKNHSNLHRIKVYKNKTDVLNTRRVSLENSICENFISRTIKNRRNIILNDRKIINRTIHLRKSIAF